MGDGKDEWKKDESCYFESVGTSKKWKGSIWLWIWWQFPEVKMDYDNDRQAMLMKFDGKKVRLSDNIVYDFENLVSEAKDMKQKIWSKKICNKSAKLTEKTKKTYQIVNFEAEKKSFTWK